MAVCEFGVRVCGGRPSLGGTVQADVTPPCLEGGGEDRPGYVRGGGGGDAAESEGAALAPVQLRDCGSGAACGVGSGCGGHSNTGGQVDRGFWDWQGSPSLVEVWWRWHLRYREAHKRTGYPLLPFRFPLACEVIVQTSSPATNRGGISSMPPSAGTVIT